MRTTSISTGYEILSTAGFQFPPFFLKRIAEVPSKILFSSCRVVRLNGFVAPVNPLGSIISSAEWQSSVAINL